jgi:hypothetical protein
MLSPRDIARIKAEIGASNNFARNALIAAFENRSMLGSAKRKRSLSGETFKAIKSDLN